MVVSSSKTHPLVPPLKQTYFLSRANLLFERGRNFKRGLRPLSLTLPSPAINNYEFLPMFPAGERFTLKVLPEGAGVRLSHTNQMQTEPYTLGIYQYYIIVLKCIEN